MNIPSSIKTFNKKSRKKRRTFLPHMREITFKGKSASQQTALKETMMRTVVVV
jgi:hypothetical protein